MNGTLQSLHRCRLGAAQGFLQERNSSGDNVSYRVLILRAGSGMANNVIRSLRAGDPSLEIVGCHDEHFVLQKSIAHRNYATPLAGEGLVPGLNRIIEQERIDLLIPVTDGDVRMISAARHALGCTTFLPRHEAIERCQDKFALSHFLEANDIPVAKTYEIPGIDAVDDIFERFQPRQKLWCRVRSGTGSFGAIPVINAEQVKAWIAYWRDMRDVSEDAFTLSEFLPGKDYYVQSLWRDGKPILTKMAERLAYLDNGSPSGMSSLSSLARTAYDADVVSACLRAISLVDADASGVYFIDVKLSASGAPCITEINAGRFTIGTNILDLTGKANMAALYVRAAMGELTHLEDTIDYEPNQYAVRAIDTEPLIVGAGAVFDLTARS